MYRVTGGPSKVILMSLLAISRCTIDGISYMDPLNFGHLRNSYTKGANPCNPLYWYPRPIPEFCLKIEKVTTTEKLVTAPPLPTVSTPIAIPVPIASPLPIPVPPVPPTFVMPPPALPGSFAALFPFDISVMSPPAITPYSQQFYSSFGLRSLPPSQAGIMPGIPGLVTKDGGLNILPFSDAYSDMLEKHKQKMIRRRLQDLLDDYEYFPLRHGIRKSRHRLYLD